MDTHAELEAVLRKVRAEIGSYFTGEVTVEQGYALRQYAKSKTDFSSRDLTAEQAAWKLAYDGLTKALREAAPEMMAKVEPLEKQMRTAENLKRAMEASMAAHPHDQGFRVTYGAMALAAIIGWFQSRIIGSTLLYGLAGGLAGLWSSIFVLDSPYVQSVLGLLCLKRVGLKGLGYWLYSRSLGFRPEGSGRIKFIWFFLLYTAITAWAFFASLEVISGVALIPRIAWLYPDPKAGCILCPKTRGQYVIHDPQPLYLPPLPPLLPRHIGPYDKASRRFTRAAEAHDQAMLWELGLGTGFHILAALNILFWVSLLDGLPHALKADLSNLAPRSS